jgi:hypothetical protein
MSPSTTTLSRCSTRVYQRPLKNTTLSGQFGTYSSAATAEFLAFFAVIAGRFLRSIACNSFSAVLLDRLVARLILTSPLCLLEIELNYEVDG